MTALGNYNSLGLRDVLGRLLRKGLEIAESVELLGTCVLTQGNNMVFGAHYEQCGGLDEVVFVSYCC